MTEQRRRRAAIGSFLTPAEAVVAHRPFTVNVEGQHVAIGAGDWLHKDDPLVVDYPESFESVKDYEERSREQREARESYLAEVNKSEWET